MAPRFSSSGSFSGVYGIVGASISIVVDETVNYANAVMLFQQTSAPTGWTKSTTDDDAILTATTGSLTTGGSLGFTSAFNANGRISSGSVTFNSFTVSPRSMLQSMIPDHTHPITGYPIAVPNPFRGPSPSPTINNPAARPVPTDLLGPGAYPAAASYTGPTAHLHPNPSAGLTTNQTSYFVRNFDLKYVDVIIATKD